MSEALRDLGIGGIFAVLILRMVFDFLKTQKDKRNGNGKPPSAEMQRDLADIHETISARDAEGNRLIYRQTGLRDAIEDLTDAIKDQTRWLEKVNDDVKEIKSKVS